MLNVTYSKGRHTHSTNLEKGRNTQQSRIWVHLENDNTLHISSKLRHIERE